MVAYFAVEHLWSPVSITLLDVRLFPIFFFLSSFIDKRLFVPYLRQSCSYCEGTPCAFGINGFSQKDNATGLIRFRLGWALSLLFHDDRRQGRLKKQVNGKRGEHVPVSNGAPRLEQLEQSARATFSSGGPCVITHQSKSTRKNGIRDGITKWRLSVFNCSWKRNTLLVASANLQLI